ncbi:MAG: mucin9 [Actinomycetota bacterium]|jgi:hypothetical protein
MEKNWSWRRSPAVIMAVAALAVVVAWSGRSQAAAPPITVSAINAKFFDNPTDDGAFTATTSTPVDFTMTVPVLNWNPPTGAQVGCSNATNVDEETRPFTDVVPQSDGTCSTVQAKNSTIQEGCDDTVCAGYTGPARLSFDAEFEGTFTVAAAGDITFNFFSDDGWLLGIGANGANQPTYVSGGDPGPSDPTTTPFKGYNVVGANNTTHAPDQDDVVVHFPAAGTYPFELDYAEAAGGQLALTLDAAGAPIGATGPTTTTSTTVAGGPTTTTSTTLAGGPTTTTSTTVAGGATTTTSTTLASGAGATTTTSTTVRAATIIRTGSDESGRAIVGAALLAVGAVAVAVAGERRRRGAHYLH